MDDSTLEVLIVPFIDMIRAGGGMVASGSAGGGSRGVLANSAAAVATATCTFISLLAHASAPSYSNVAPNSSSSGAQISPQCEFPYFFIAFSSYPFLMNSVVCSHGVLVLPVS